MNRPGTLQSLEIDEHASEGVEVAYGRAVAHQRMIKQELQFGMAVGSLRTGALAVDRLIERTLAIEGGRVVVRPEDIE